MFVFHLSDLMEFRRKLFLGKAEGGKWGMSQPEGSIQPLVSCTVQKPRRGSCFPGTHSTLETELDLESGQRLGTREPLLAVG